MRTLLEYLINPGLQYSQSWGIWAESFDLQSPARLGQFIFDNGGMIDDFIPIGNLEKIINSRQNWSDNPDDWEDWAKEYIFQLQKEILYESKMIYGDEM